MNKLILAGLALGVLAVPALAQMAPGERPAAKPQKRADVEAKVRARFAELDTNRDGFLTRDEMHARMEKMMAERQAGAFDALDTDHNGSISREEFAARGKGDRMMVMRFRDGETMPPPPPPGADGKGPMAPPHHMMMMRERRMGGPGGGGHMMMMGMMDKDGRVSIDAMVRSALERFDKADANHDGVLTPDERKAAREAWRSMRRGAVG